MRAPSTVTSPASPARDLTVVRIPLRGAKHHFGAAVSRGTRPYNEDTYQAGTIGIPAFAKRAPISLSRTSFDEDPKSRYPSSADPQVFYFGVFDGHGGHECSDFLREELHTYLESTAKSFCLRSTLVSDKNFPSSGAKAIPVQSAAGDSVLKEKGQDVLDHLNMKTPAQVKDEMQHSMARPGQQDDTEIAHGAKPVTQDADSKRAMIMERALLSQWKETVGGYFRRFRPAYFSPPTSPSNSTCPQRTPVSLETVLMYSFLKADLDFITAQTRKPDPDDHTDRPLNADEIFGEPAFLSPSNNSIGGPKRFLGGSTASIALVSTPTPTPFWHPASTATIVTAHVGDTRILLCDTATGLPRPLTTNHHPNSPLESMRLRRYAATFVVDSFGEERMSGLANTRAFGDMQSKRIGISAEPEIVRLDIAPAEYSFLVLVSDGVSGTLSDQEIVDIVKEAKTPEQGARNVISFATEVTKEGDNATCLVVRLGGWERRSEGGMGSLGTREMRDYRQGEASDPRWGSDMR